jgi:hypothetical protein
MCANSNGGMCVCVCACVVVILIGVMCGVCFSWRRDDDREGEREREK